VLVIRVMRLPTSPKNSMPPLFMAPMVSAAIGMNEYDCVIEAYLVIFLFAAASAAAPGVCDDIGWYDCAIVSVTVTSHVTHLPLFHGNNY